MTSYLIGIAGPSGAGKSTFCRRLEREHTNVGRLKLDDFFCDATDVGHLNGYQNWDDPSSIDWVPLIHAAKTLKSQGHATVPHYDRALDKRTGEKCLMPKDLVIVDGFLTLHHPELRSLIDVSFFFNLSEPEQVSRRKARQPWVEDGYLQDVMLPNARTYVMPSAKFASHVIDAHAAPETIYTDILSLLHSHNIHPILKAQ